MMARIYPALGYSLSSFICAVNHMGMAKVVAVVRKAGGTCLWALDGRRVENVTVITQPLAS